MDPIETYDKAAYFEGLFLRKLFTFKLRTRNIFSLLFMLAFGIALIGFMAYAIFGLSIATPSQELNLGDKLIFFVVWLIFFFLLSIGIALIINFLLNIMILIGLIKVSSGLGKPNDNKPKRKLPKSRKDYK